MEKDTAELVVKIYAVLAWISAVFALIGALGILLWSGVAGGMMGAYGGGAMSSGIFAGLGMVFGIFLLAMAVFDVFVGLGLWQHKPWARIATLIFSVLSLFSFPIGTIIGAVGIWLFGFEPAVTGLFGAAPVNVGSKPAKKK